MMQDARALDRASIAQMLDRLIAGLASLRDEGRFPRPNLGRRPGDFLSFDSWEWPQGIWLSGLFRAWEASGPADQLALLQAGTPSNWRSSCLLSTSIPPL